MTTSPFTEPQKRSRLVQSRCWNPRCHGRQSTQSTRYSSGRRTLASTCGTCYAASDDAYHWRRAELGEVAFDGSTANNILKEGIVGSSGVFVDPHSPSAERFKAMGGDMAWYDPATWEMLDGKETRRRNNAQEYEGDRYDGPRAEAWGRMLGWTSPDGLSWT